MYEPMFPRIERAVQTYAGSIRAKWVVKRNGEMLVLRNKRSTWNNAALARRALIEWLMVNSYQGDLKQIFPEVQYYHQSKPHYVAMADEYIHAGLFTIERLPNV